MDTPADEHVEDLEAGARIARELDIVGDRREVKVAGIRVSGRRRRPAGEKPPLERQLRLTGRLWLAAGLTMIVLWITLFTWPASRNWWTERDLMLLEWFVELRTDILTSIADVAAFFGTPAFVRVLRLGTLLALVVVRRWRHVFAVLIAIVIVAVTVFGLQELVARPRPFVPIIGSWSGASHPSATVAGIAVTLSAMAYSLVPAGRRRWVALGMGASVTFLIGLANVYLGVDHPTDVVVSAVYAPAVTVVLFRWFAPETSFPVAWRRGVTAHLDVSGRRGEAIKRAVGRQLGMQVLAIEPFGQEGSGGSTPVRLRVAGDPDQWVFAKLYS